MIHRKSFSFRAAALLLALMCGPAAFSRAAAPSDTAQWPQWRGPHRDDISTETGLLAKWPEGGPKLAWRAGGLGQGFSTVAIADGRIFTTGDTPKGCYLYALNVEDGKPLWAARIGDQGLTSINHPGARGTPTIAGDSVYAEGQFGELICVEAATGAERWRTNIKTQYGGEQMSMWAYAESPLVDGSKVIVTPGGKKGAVMAFDRKTGKVAWRCRQLTDKAGYTSMIAEDIGGVHQYIVLTESDVAGIAAQNGALLWKAPRGGRTAVIPTPVFSDNKVFVTSGYGAGCSLFAIEANGASFSAKEMYHSKEMVNHHGGVVLVNGCIYGSSDPGILKCMDFNTGDVKWKDRDPGKGSLTYADGHLYFRNESKAKVMLIRATPDGYTVDGEFTPPDHSPNDVWSHPVVCGGKLYLRDNENLLVYDIKAR